MRQRRDPFGRQILVPVKVDPISAPKADCYWCDAKPSARRPLYRIHIETDGGRMIETAGSKPFCSWSCWESYR